MSFRIDQLEPVPGSFTGGAEAYFTRAVGDAWTRAGDLHALLSLSGGRWTDALLSEARAHLFGCLNGVQLAIGLQLGQHWLARPLDALGAGYCREAIERHPAVLSGLLVDHLRHRAAAALMTRLAVEPPTALQVAGDDDAGAERDTTGDARLDDALAALRLSVDPWFAPHPVDLPMRTDLAAEPYCDLVWSATALLVDGLCTGMGVEDAAALVPLGRAAEAVIARHDEQTGPFARSAYVAAIARDADNLVHLANQAAIRRDLLLLAALCARRAAMDQDMVLSMMIDGDDREIAALAMSVRLSRAAYGALLAGLGPVRGGLSDESLEQRIANYSRMTSDDATELLARYQGPQALIAKRARIDWRRG